MVLHEDLAILAADAGGDSMAVRDLVGERPSRRAYKRHDDRSSRWGYGLRTSGGSSLHGHDPGRHRCFLSSNLEDIDSGATRLWGQVGRSHIAVMDLTHRLVSPGIASILCRSDAPAGQVRVESIRITAIRVGTLTEYDRVRAGTTTGSGTPRVIARARDSATVIGQSSYETVATLPLPSQNATWMVVAKVRAKLPNRAVAMCELVAGTASDTGTTGFLSASNAPKGTLSGRRTLALRLTVADLGSSATVTLRCRNDYPLIYADDVPKDLSEDYSVDYVSGFPRSSAPGEPGMPFVSAGASCSVPRRSRRSRPVRARTS